MVTLNSSDNVIVRKAQPDRTLSPMTVLKLSGRISEREDGEAVSAMPRGEGEQLVFFFQTCKEDNDRLESFLRIDYAYRRRGLKPADPYSLISINTYEPEFADMYPNVTFWKSGGEMRHIFFCTRQASRRIVRVEKGRGGIFSDCWLAGIAE